ASRSAARVMAKGIQEMESSTHQLAKMGWTLPGWCSFREVQWILSHETQEAVDNCFVTLYDPNTNDHLTRMRAEMISSPALEQWKELIVQCWEAYDRSHFLIAVPALITVLEGLIANSDESFRGEKNIRKCARRKVKHH